MATFEVRVTTDLLNKQLNTVGDHLLEGTYLEEEREVDRAQLQLPAMRGTPAHMAKTGCHHMVHTSAGDMVYYRKDGTGSTSVAKVNFHLKLQGKVHTAVDLYKLKPGKVDEWLLDVPRQVVPIECIFAACIWSPATAGTVCILPPPVVGFKP